MRKSESVGVAALTNGVVKLLGLRLTDTDVAALVAHPPVTLSMSTLATTVERLCDTLEAHGVLVEGLFRVSGERGAVESLLLLLTVRPDTVDERVMVAAGPIVVANALCRLLSSTQPPLLDIHAEPLTADRLVSTITDAAALRIVHRVVAMMRALVAAPATKVVTLCSPPASVSLVFF